MKPAIVASATQCIICLDNESSNAYVGGPVCKNEGSEIFTKVMVMLDALDDRVQLDLQVHGFGKHGLVHQTCLNHALAMKNACPMCRLPNIKSERVYADRIDEVNVRRGHPIVNMLNLISEDLSGLDFSRINLAHADLRYSNLSNANLSNANLSNANLSNANLSNANLSYANLSNADLREVNLNDANLHGANLRGAYLQDAYMIGTDLREADLREITLSGSTQLYI